VYSEHWRVFSDKAGSIAQKRPRFGTIRQGKVRFGVLAQLDYFLIADQPLAEKPRLGLHSRIHDRLAEYGEEWHQFPDGFSM
jgi:hypothetical protein